jgi:hypothetical protein
MLSSPKDALARLIGDLSLNKCKLCHGFPIIAKAISGMTAQCNPPATGKNQTGQPWVKPGYDNILSCPITRSVRD